MDKSIVTRTHFRRLLSSAAALLALALSLHAAAGTVIDREFKSAALNGNWSYTIYLPNGYESSNLSYPVLYLLHGNGGNRYNWVNDGHIKQTADMLIASGDIPPCLIVMPDAGASWYVDRKEYDRRCDEIHLPLCRAASDERHSLIRPGERRCFASKGDPACRSNAQAARR